MNTQFNSNVIWLQLEYKISTLVGREWTKFFLALHEVLSYKVTIFFSVHIQGMH